MNTNGSFTHKSYCKTLVGSQDLLGVEEKDGRKNEVIVKKGIKTPVSGQCPSRHQTP